MPTESSFDGSSLCVVGNVNRDLQTAPLRAGGHLFADGETSVSSIVETIGGGGANSVCAAASLAARVGFLVKVGADAPGQRLERTLRQHGSDARLAKDGLLRSGTSIALGFEDGQRHFLSCLPANEALSFADLDLTALKGRAEECFGSGLELDKTLATQNSALHAKVAGGPQSKSGLTFQPLDKAKIAGLPATEMAEVEAVRTANNQSTLAKVAVLPALMFPCYLGLILLLPIAGRLPSDEVDGSLAVRGDRRILVGESFSDPA